VPPYGTRLVNNEVSLDTVRRVLDHDSSERTSATDSQGRDAGGQWERFREGINIRG
jgi:hypothetical protein